MRSRWRIRLTAGPPEPPPASAVEPLLARVIGAGARSGFRVAEATGIDRALEEIVAEAVVRALESPAAERAIAQALESEAVERSLNRAIDSQMVDRVWERLLASDEIQKLIEWIAEAPEIRQAIAYQGVGLVDDIGAQIGRIARRVDVGLERIVRTVLRRPQREGPASRQGSSPAGLAFALDARDRQRDLSRSRGAARVHAPGGLQPRGRPRTPRRSWSASLLWFARSRASTWSASGDSSGETPGMRFLDMRLYGPEGRRLGFRRAAKRLVGVVLGAIPLGLGFWIVLFGEQRRSFADRFAETEMRYLPPRREAPRRRADEDPREFIASRRLRTALL